MLNSIHIVNFQCHKDRLIKLDPITVLIGDNGRGKSAIIRALRWAALNEWAGQADKFIRWGQENAQVSLRFKQNRITRTKGALGNLYALNSAELEAVSNKVPEEIRRLVSMTEDNFHEQLDPAFWFSLTAGQVAKSLNKIINLTEIDASLAEIGKATRQAKDKLTMTQERLTEARNIKKSLDWTKVADETLSRLEEKTKDHAEIVSGSTKLASGLAQMARLSSIKQHASKAILSGQIAIDRMGKLVKLNDKIETAQKLLDEFTYNRSRKKWIKTELLEKEKELHKLMKGRCPLCHRSATT